MCARLPATRKPAGVISMTKTIAREYAARGIIANAIAPGFIDTGGGAVHIQCPKLELVVD